jgi:hypothetical protein
MNRPRIVGTLPCRCIFALLLNQQKSGSLLVYLLIFLSVSTGAQLVTSTISGTVSDPGGAVVAEAVVTVMEIEARAVRMAETDQRGSYQLAGLPPGQYTLQVQKSGFKTFHLQGIALAVNQQPVVDVRLEVGPAKEQVTVQADISQLESSTAQLGGVVSGRELRQLPLNGRDLQQLILLQTGAVQSSNAGVNSFGLGTINKVAVQGTRPMMNNLTIDGADINDPSFNVPPGNLAGVQLGVDAMQEFGMVLDPYSAQYGRNSGANVQFITRSGTNSFHGSAYGFLRNASLDAANYFDALGKPYFARYQFGGTSDGPIIPDKTFFFMNYEGFREQRGLTVSTTVPDSNAHLGLLPSSANAGQLVQVPVNSAIAPFLNLFPMPDGPELGSGFAVYNVSLIQPTHENYGLVRVDHKLANNDQLFGRYIIDNGDSRPPFQSTSIPGFPGIDTIADQFLALGEQHIFGPALLNDFRFSFSRTKYGANTDNSYPLSISLLPGRALGGISVSGLPLLGNNLIYPINSTDNVFEFIDDVSYQKGTHSLRFGTDDERLQMNGAFDLYSNGEYVFADLSAFGIQAITTNPAFENFLAGVPEVYLGTNPSLGDSSRGFRQTNVSLYSQDNWKAMPNLTLNYGLRWEHVGNPGETQGKLANIRNLATDAQPTVGKIWASVPWDLWSPRFGFTYSPRKNGATVIRGGYGINRDQLYENLYGNTRYYPPFFQSFSYILPLFQAPPQSVTSIIGPGGAPKTIGSDGTTYYPRFPYYYEFSLGIQREFLRDYLLELNYVGSLGRHLPNAGEANLLPGGKAINPHFGSLLIVEEEASSNYDGLQASLKKRMSNGLSMRASYTFSKVLDDASGPFPSDYVSESGYAQNFFNLRGDYGRSAFDRRHVLVFSSLYNLRAGAGARLRTGLGGLMNSVAAGWQLGGILSLESGLPFSVNLGSFDNAGLGTSSPAQRPDTKPGSHYCESTNPGKPSEWFDPAIFTLPATGTYGNTPRNAMCGPALYELDFSLTKETKLTERVTLQFRGEFFNILNHPNFSVPVNTQGPNGSGGNGDQVFNGRLSDCDPASSSTGCGAPNSNSGRIFSTVTTSRQIQFGLKLIF